MFAILEMEQFLQLFLFHRDGGFSSGGKENLQLLVAKVAAQCPVVAVLLQIIADPVDSGFRLLLAIWDSRRFNWAVG